jgi:methyltransferase
MTLATAVLIFVTLQRLGEMLLAHRNTRNLRARGAFEVSPRHYPLLVAMHAGWLAALWILGRDQPVNLFGLGIFVMLQGVRIWIIASLGPRWTTRIMVLPGAPLVTRGPYRFMSHPNYAVVICEIAVLPVTFGLCDVALLFSVLNALILTVRIGAESRALSSMSQNSAV